MNYDYVVIGAGLSGITIANILANKGKKVLLTERRNHIGGNCYDEYMDGILVHKYGPHIFHTDNEKVFNYLSQFTEWNGYEHKVLAEVNSKLIPLPFNLDSLRALHSWDDYLKYLQLFKDNNIRKCSILYLMKHENIELQRLGHFIYGNIYYNYSAKQWSVNPDELNEEILKRVPIRIDYNDYYFEDKYQGLPLNGYTEMFKKMLNNKNIDIKLNADYNYWSGNEGESVIYTGKIDELFNYCYGKLQYRSLDFKFETYEYTNKEYYQECGVINYSNHATMTRITEFKYLTKQKSDKTVIAKEYPKECNYLDIPYYPINNEVNNNLYLKYKEMADKVPNLYLLGRLAEYKYYDMDDIVDSALQLGDKLNG